VAVLLSPSSFDEFFAGLASSALGLLGDAADANFGALLARLAFALFHASSGAISNAFGGPSTQIREL